MGDRVKHFRAGLLLALSSAVVIWPISFWFPLSDYLVSIGEEEYADFERTLQIIISIYIGFFTFNLITAGLCATKLSYKIKFWLSIVPAITLLVVPVLLVIPMAGKYPEQSFIEVFQGLYQLLRFASPEILGAALVLTLIAVVLNIRAALTLRNAPDPERVPKHLSYRYLIYTGVMMLVLVSTVLVSASNSSTRASDRKACLDFAALATPEYNNQVEAYISNVKKIAEETEAKNMETLFLDFSGLSTDYVSLVIAEPENSIKLAELGEAITATKSKIDVACSEV